MLLRFVAIRLIQIFRSFTGIGLIRMVVLLSLFVFLSVQLYANTQLWPNAMYVAIIVVIAVGAIHLKRPDTLFLKTSFPNHKTIVLIEYLSFSLPILAMMALHRQWVPALAMSIGIALMSRIDIKKRTSNFTVDKRITGLFPPIAFEWKSGVRKSWPVIMPAWLLGLVFVNFIGSVPIAIILVGMVTFGFYEEGEPYPMLTALELSPSQLIKQKALLNMGIFAVLMLPHVLSFMVIHSEYWYIAPGVWLMLSTLHGYLTLTKYAFYQPGIKLAAAQSFYTIGFISIFAPIMLPVIWLLAIRFYFVSKRHLKPYLHDFNRKPHRCLQ